MRKLAFNYSMNIKFSQNITNHLYQLKCLIPDNLYQKVNKCEISILPKNKYALLSDGFFNKVISGQIFYPHDYFNVEVNGEVEVDYVKNYQEQCHPIYKFETDLTKYDEAMNSLIYEADSFYELMMRICENIYYELYYTPNVTNVNTTAKEAFDMKKGVCQDFAHIMLAIVRHLGYPARYVAGMMVGEGETHAWVEVYNNGRWYGFDPTNNRKVNNQYIVISKGRDYKDCAIDKGTFMVDGFANQQMKAHVNVKVID